MITPGELSVGDYITAHSWKPRDIPDLDSFSLTATKTFSDRSWCGDVLRIKAIQLPYIIVNSYNGYSDKDRPIRLDTREANLMSLSDDYPNACGIKKESSQ